MDHLLYIAMSGAKENMNALALRSNNLANATTVGFKADLQQARAMQAFGDGLPTRVFSMTESPSQNFDTGELKITENELDPRRWLVRGARCQWPRSVYPCWEFTN